ncbi:MAG: glycosyltransferase [Clostridia bacterium]|nr:glycosyltransferase [Clostridia bacterium]
MGPMVRIQAQAVLYHNDLGSIRQTLRAVANAARYAREQRGLEIAVSMAYGDSGETPLPDEQELELWREIAGDMPVSYRHFGFNAGSAHGQNLLAEGFDGDYVLIMNPDVKPCPDFFHQMLQPFGDEKVAAVEARQCPVEHHKDYDPATGRTDWCTGACTMIRNRVFREVGGFDWKTFFLYCDDVDLSWRMKLAGYTLVYQPHAMVYHAKELSGEGGWMPTRAEMVYSAEAALLMAWKWGDDKRLGQLLERFKRGGEAEKLALQSYRKRKREGTLPEKIRADRRVATFTGNYYGKNRFTY